VKLYSYYRSTSSYRVRIVLNAKGIPYEYRAINLDPRTTEQDSAGYERINPMRQVPVLEWEEGGSVRRLSQSVAIVEYLEELRPRPSIMPSDALERAGVREIVEIVNSGIQPLQNSRTLAGVRALAGDVGAQGWARDAIGRGLGAIERLSRGHGGAFLLGDEMSLAEVFLVPQLYNARRFGVDLAGYGKIRDVEARCLELQAFSKAHPDRQPDSPPKTHPEGDGR
jgi:maleylpyruvate isomerase